MLSCWIRRRKHSGIRWLGPSHHLGRHQGCEPVRLVVTAHQHTSPHKVVSGRDKPLVFDGALLLVGH